MRSLIGRIRALLVNEQGAASILIVLFLGLFGLAFAALVVDASMLYAKRSEMITAADAAALAGANVMREHVTQGVDPNSQVAKDAVEAVARQYALDNGAHDELIEITLGSRQVSLPNGSKDYRQVIDVHVGVDEPSFFARFMGDEENRVVAEAIVTWGYIYKSYAGNILPIFTFDSDYTTEEQTYLHDLIETPGGKGSDNSYTNSYGYIQMGNGKSIIKDALAGRYTGDTYTERNILDGEPGKGNFVSGEIETRMKDAAKKGTPGERRSHMMGLIPVISWERFVGISSNIKEMNSDGTIGKLNNKLKLPIEYFAYFEITDVIKSNDNIGSAFALNPREDPASQYLPVGNSGVVNYKDVVGKKPSSDLLVGHFTGEIVQARTLVEVGDQTNPNKGSDADVSAMYAQIIR